MGAARVVADHAAKCAAAVGGRIGSEREVVHFGRVAQRIENQTRLNPGETLNRIDFQNPVHVLGEVENDGDVAALPRQARAGASRQNRRAVLPAHGHRRDNVVGVLGDNKTDWDLSVI
jgi:hypothetical protein